VKKIKKISPRQSKPRLGEIPALDCFELLGRGGQPFEWQGWGLVIRYLRDFTDMDQSIFGRLLQGYTRGQIARYETEQAEPPIDFWVKMMRTFGLNISWALTGQGIPHITEFCDCEERKRFYKWAELLRAKVEFLWELQGQ